MSDSPLVPIRSFRLVFALERRIHKVERWRIPVPFGVPLRGVAYATATLATVLLVSRLPLVGGVVVAVHPALRLVALPLVSGFALFRLNIDGRAAHHSLFGWLRYRANPRRLCAFRPAPELEGAVLLIPVPIAHDELAARLAAGEVRGPARVVLRYPFRADARSRVVRVTQLPGPPRWRGRRLTLSAGQRLVVR